MTEEYRVLLVDDEINVLRGISRQLRRVLALDTAVGAVEGQRAVRQNGPYAVVVSDMRMPHMSGAEFLAWVRQETPDTIRMMLTAHAEIEVATAAVNEGHIFRFLTKPCPSDELLRAVRDGIRQYQLITAERELLDKTLKGSIQMLSEILSLVSPLSFRRTSGVVTHVRETVKALRLPNPWQFELAAMLSQIGCLALPSAILEKVNKGQPLTPAESSLYRDHPKVAARLLSRIPRLQVVAEMILRQGRPFSSHEMESTSKEEMLKNLGGQLVKAACEFDRLLSIGFSREAAVDRMQQEVNQFDPKILGLFRKPGSAHEVKAAMVFIRDLREGMLLDQDVRAKNGILLVRRGTHTTHTVLERLEGFAQSVGVEEPIRVLVEAQHEENVDDSPEESTQRPVAV